MVRLLLKKSMPYILCVLVILCLLCWSNFAFAEGVEQDDVCVADYNVLNTENDSEERLSSLLSIKTETLPILRLQTDYHRLQKTQGRAVGNYKDICVEDPVIRNAQDDGVEKMISLNSKMSTNTSTEEHYLRIKEQLSDYKKGIENYVD